MIFQQIYLSNRWDTNTQSQSGAGINGNKVVLNILQSSRIRDSPSDIRLKRNNKI